MRSKNLYVAAVLVLSAGCASIGLFNLKPPPDIDECSMVWNGTLETSYAYCISVNPISKREYRKPAADVFKQKMIGTSAKDFASMEKYVEYLEAQAKRRCQ